jgi:hypothetical protein
VESPLPKRASASKRRRGYEVGVEIPPQLRREEEEMNTYKVIEGTVWEIKAGSLEEAKAIYEAHFNGEGDDLPMSEIEGSNYWYAEGEEELATARATLDAVAYEAGAVATLEWLEEIYGEGIKETDAWQTHIGDDEEEIEE